MSASLNKVQLLGHLGKTPEIRTTQEGTKIANFSLATSEYWKDKTTHERKEKTEWHKIVVFNERLAEITEMYLKKGSKVYIEGQLQTRKWTDKEGKEKYVTEIVLQKFKGEILLMDSKSDSHPPEAPQYEGPRYTHPYDKPLAAYSGNSGDTPYVDIELAVNKEVNDEIPF